MNEYEIEQAKEKYQKAKDQNEVHFVLHQATEILDNLKNKVNEVSDGWAYWKAPVLAAKKLMLLIQNPETANKENLKKALIPIKSFLTKKGITL